jgi:hypothetical protein
MAGHLAKAGAMTPGSWPRGISRRSPGPIAMHCPCACWSPTPFPGQRPEIRDQLRHIV